MPIPPGRRFIGSNTKTVFNNGKSGPSHNRNDKTTACAGVVFEDKSAGCYAPVLYDTEKGELVYTPIYYYIGHFSKYVHRGATRTATTKYDERLFTIAFKNPDGSLVLVVQNTADQTMPLVIRHEDICTETEIAAHSIITVLL